MYRGGGGGIAATKVYNPFPIKVYLPADGNLLLKPTIKTL